MNVWVRMSVSNEYVTWAVEALCLQLYSFLRAVLAIWALEPMFAHIADIHITVSAKDPMEVTQKRKYELVLLNHRPVFKALASTPHTG